MNSQDELVKEEQKILNELIEKMDNALLSLNRSLSYDNLQIKKAKEKCLPDTYGQLISAQNNKNYACREMTNLRQVRNELYSTRIVVKIDDGMFNEEELKIDLHTYTQGQKIFVINWKMPICRHYLLDNSAEEYESKVFGKYGEVYRTHYQLLLKRKVHLDFDKVKGVTHFFPTYDKELGEIIADEFLQELLNRRSEQEFKNIVFSIQKQQGEIIQTPFKQNLIVQGCAGSGKSMIMLHRLPIVIYDNPNTLNKSNLYIITPSDTYIQMAENMRVDLEIEDLNMGTLEQYYNFIIKRYNRSPEEYGRINPHIKLPNELEKYVYSRKCIDDISAYIDEQIDKIKVNCDLGYEIFEIEKIKNNRKIKSKSEKLRREILIVQQVLNENDNIIKNYYRLIWTLISETVLLARSFETRKISIEKEIEQRISAQESRIENVKKENKNLKNVRIYQALIIQYQNVLHAIDQNEGYFIELKKIAKEIRKVLDLFKNFRKNRERVEVEEQYKGIENRKNFIELLQIVIDKVKLVENPYVEYKSGWDKDIKSISNSIEALKQYNKPYISYEYFKELNMSIKKYKELDRNIISDIYLHIMKKLGQEKELNKSLTALKCSPYIYLQILYIYYGAPSGKHESLITIDEAQNLSKEEFRLIRKVNWKKVVLNLFGDVNQHIEGSKGIDDWQEIKNVAGFETRTMNENYRNARQITEYCNNRFNLEMRAINLDGKGVHEMISEAECYNELTKLFQSSQNPGLSCILVKNNIEADKLLYSIPLYKNRVNDMTKEPKELHKNKWNIMTIDQAKGLEFETVFVVSGRMSDNEKYIAYTRALNELFVYDNEIKLADNIKETNIYEKTLNNIKNENINGRRKRRKRTPVITDESKVRKFFVDKGLEVKDLRKDNGYLWVIGEKADIEPIVQEAIDKYSISGEYGCGKTTGYKNGWYTKSKK